MARKYGHIQNYEKEIKEMLKEGMTQREIGEALGFSKEQVSGFVKRLHAKERKAAAGEALRKKGRPAKSDKYTQTDKVSELKYMLCSYVNKKHKLNRPKEERLYHPTKSRME